MDALHEKEQELIMEINEMIDTELMPDEDFDDEDDMDWDEEDDD
tara:strand:+ start:861 stop:992 length:132 start_codon:yes stop_codon:yes gene_type:complete